MSSVVIAGDTSGTVTLAAPAVAGTTTLTLPTVSGGTLVTSDSSGNVGIGTTSPSYKLDVNNAVSRIGDSTGLGFLQLGSSATASNNFHIGDNAGAFIFYQGNYGAGTERMRVDSSGNVLVGTATQIIDELFGVNQAGTSKSAIIAKAATTGTAAIRTVKVTNVNNSTQLHLAFAYNNGNNGNGAIAGNGDSQAAFATFSDSRLKKNIEDLPNQLDKINALRPVEFDYIKSGEHQIGFIAQEVREVYPDLVAEGEDEMLTVIGLGKTEARLIKAIQEQQELIKQLQADVAALKGAA